ncbi:MAG: response regulator transcription factor [Armatimonadetes bacterium]|nr:response regulator transcription factor [Armatimonadota bacterium]MDW8028292.1 response regulator transcription factor [Armatimonadota bacterium]
MSKRNRTSLKEGIVVVVCDRQPLFRLGLRLLFERQGNFIVAAEVSNLEELFNAVAQSFPDIILLDILVAEKDNFEVLRKIRLQYPSLKIVLTVPRDVHPLKLTSAIQAGASSCILRDSPPDLVIKAIQSVVAGLPWVQRELTESLFKVINSSVIADETLETLTEKERQVLILIAKGLTNKEIAKQLGLSLQTVKTHVSKILQKLKVKTRMEAARYAVSLLKSSFDGQRLKVSAKR